jgi:hypothetical protein
MMLQSKKLLLIAAALTALSASQAYAGETLDDTVPGHPPQRVARMGEKAVACWQTVRTLLIAEGVIDNRLRSSLECWRKYHFVDRDFLGIMYR